MLMKTLEQSARTGELSLEFRPVIDSDSEQINTLLKQYQIACEWDKQKLIGDLHRWAGICVFEFKLKTGTPAIMIDRLSRSRFGHYRGGRNGFGLCDEIAINQIYLSDQSYWETLGTLLHELLHAEQEHSGRPGQHNYHNNAFRDRAFALGLIIDSRGYTQYTPAPSPFFDILEKCGVQAPIVHEPIHEVTKPAGKSKLKLWMCKCEPNPVRVRVAIGDFQARCMKCHELFELVKY